ncbi:FtsB family cell division protein [Actinomyces minihominis]|uniref:FtsB family cell division protein n=1 Tax=Actinomyces minihominis TaxID=2002838 RepID=UPI000C0818BF|nr:septum formation initiator family protein [Actinomyces minihominis]
MSSSPRPPQRPRTRSMLDASTKQTVTTPKEAKVAPQASEVPSSTGPTRVRRSTANGFGYKPGTSRPSGTTRPTGAREQRAKPMPQKPSEAGKATRKPIRIHSKREPLKWSFGGLTVSVRLLVAFVIVAVLVVVLVPLGLQWLRQEQSYHAVVAEVEAAEVRAGELQDQLARWEDEDYIAAQARERIGFVRPGETQFVVTDAPEPEESTDLGREHNNLSGPEKPWAWVVLESLREADQPSTTGELAKANQNEEKVQSNE